VLSWYPTLVNDYPDAHAVWNTGLPHQGDLVGVDPGEPSAWKQDFWQTADGPSLLLGGRFELENLAIHNIVRIVRALRTSQMYNEHA
jgi:hypothetical protein